MFLRKISALFVAVATVATLLVGCGEGLVIKPYKTPEDIRVASSALVAENERYSLRWDSEASCVLLESKTDGKVWSTVPYKAYLEGESNATLSSPVYIQYYNPSDGGLESSKAYSDCISDGLMSAETVEDGIKLTFYFVDAEITVPLYFKLRADSLYAYVPAEEIIESGKTKLIELSVLPYLCSAANSASKENYLMLPVGCGALVYTDEEVSVVSRSFSGEVYGADAGRKQLDNTFDSEKIRIPAYGVKDGANALLAFIESGDGSARIDADAGNFRNGHSTAYTTFQVRAFDELEAVRNEYNDERIYSAEFDSSLTYGIGFYPLSGEKADYEGMAEVVRNKYGIDNGKKNTQQAYRLEILGGAVTKHFVMGVPYDALTVATTFAEAIDITDELSEKTGLKPSVTLLGFGKSGVSAGEIAGGYTFASALGGKKGQQKMESYCKENGIPLFTDFELIRFSESGSGFGTVFDGAKTASRQKAFYYPISRNLRFPDDDLKKIYLLNRTDIVTAVNKLVDKTEKLSGIAISSLGDIAYSDYGKTEYGAKGNTAEITELINKIAKKHSVSVSGANAYAASAAGTVTNVPLSNGGDHTLDAKIPFYQLVFGKTSALYSEPINIATDREDMLLRAIEMGVAPSFTVCGKYEKDFSEVAEGVFYASAFDGVKESVISNMKKAGEFFSSVSDAYIVSHSIGGNGITITEFSNGIKVTVNHSSETLSLGGATLEPLSFSISSENGKGGAQ